MWHLKHNVGSNPICSTKVWSFFQMTQSALVAPGTKGVKKPRLPNYNDYVVEWLKATVCKTVVEIPRWFESNHSHKYICPFRLIG